MENSLLVFGAVAIAAILTLVNEYSLKAPRSKSKIPPSDKMQLPSGAIEYLDTTYVPVADFLKIKDESSKRNGKKKGLKNEANRLKGTLLFVILLSVLIYFAA